MEVQSPNHWTAREFPAFLIDLWTLSVIVALALPPTPSFNGIIRFRFHCPALAAVHRTGCMWGCFHHQCSGLPAFLPAKETVFKEAALKISPQPRDGPKA